VLDLDGRPRALQAEQHTAEVTAGAAASGRILVRDSKNPDGARLGVSAQACREFAATIKNGNAG